MVHIFRHYLAAISKVLQIANAYVDPAGVDTGKPIWIFEVNKPILDILQSSCFLAFNRVKDIKLESVISVWASVFAPKTTHTQLVV